MSDQQSWIACAEGRVRVRHKGAIVLDFEHPEQLDGTSEAVFRLCDRNAGLGEAVARLEAAELVLESVRHFVDIRGRQLLRDSYYNSGAREVPSHAGKGGDVMSGIEWFFLSMAATAFSSGLYRAGEPDATGWEVFWAGVLWPIGVPYMLGVLIGRRLQK
jgi:hypothetical protein